MSSADAVSGAGAAGAGSSESTAAAPAPAAAGSTETSFKSQITQPCVCPGHQKQVTEIHFSPITPDGVFFVSGCADKMPMLRSGETGDWIGTFEGHKGAVWSCKLNKTATRVATGCADWSAKLWDAITGEELMAYPHPHIVKTVDFSPDETRLATGCNKKKVCLYDVKSMAKDPVATWDHAGTNPRKVLWSADGRQLITGGDDGVVRIWDVAAGSVAKEIKLSNPVMDLELSEGHGLLTVASGRQVTFFNSSTYDIHTSHNVDIKGEGLHGEGVESASLHPTLPRFVATGADVWVRMYDLVSGEEVVCNKGHHGPVHCVRFSPRGDCYASGSGDATIRLWPTSMGVKSE